MATSKFTGGWPQWAPVPSRRTRDEHSFHGIRKTRHAAAPNAAAKATAKAWERARLMMPVLLAAVLYTGLRIAFTYALAAH